MLSSLYTTLHEYTKANFLRYRAENMINDLTNTITLHTLARIDLFHLPPTTSMLPLIDTLVSSAISAYVLQPLVKRM